MLVRNLAMLACGALVLLAPIRSRAEAMLEIFQMRWVDLSAKMPEIAEAGYTSLWVPPPAKAGSVYSVGYDLFDPFDLGNQNQNGTVPTMYGTLAELQQMVITAHRFGIRVYFDNIMNHRQSVVPGYNSYAPTNYFPGLWPADFHLQTTPDGNRNWANVQDWNNQWDVQYEPLSGLVDLATEPGAYNGNFGPYSLGDPRNSILKPIFVRHPNHPEFYPNPAGPSLGGPWRPFQSTNGVAVADDVNSYLIRAAMWTLHTTKCDGFRLDAVKHVPSPFFGSSSASPLTDDPTFSGYTGGIQAMYDYTHGYGNNVTGNGYVEADGNRNSCFDTEAVRNDAMLFGEHMGSPPSYQEYINNGMRLLNVPLRTVFNSALSGGGSLPSGLDQRDYTPPGTYDSENNTAYSAFSAAQGVQMAEDQDQDLCCPTHREMQDAYYFMHEGLPMIYTDNFNWAGSPGNPNTFPETPMTGYLGQYGDDSMPEICRLHHQLSRGGTRPRWSDTQVVAFERYDYRDPVAGDPYTNSASTVLLFAMNATFNSSAGDVAFDDGIPRSSDGYYTCYNGSPSRGCGLGVSFPPGSVLAQMATTSPGGGNLRSCPQLLVHQATTDYSAAVASANAPNPVDRLIYVNTAPPPGGGAVEILVPAGSWVLYGYQWPEPSRSAFQPAITFAQGGTTAPRVLVYRADGTDGDPGFAPTYPFKMRGSVDPNGNPLLDPGEGHIPTLTNAAGVRTLTNTYAIYLPVLTNAAFDIQLACDASAANVLLKLDGGVDLNSQMGLGPTTGSDLRDNRPGYATDVYLGYEQAALRSRFGPEKFAARLVARDNLTSLGAETYGFTLSGTNWVVNGGGTEAGDTTETAVWVYHDPAAPATVVTNASLPVAPATQMVPPNPAAHQSVDVWVKVGYQFQTDSCFLYYTTDGTNPEGGFGVPKPGTTTQVVRGGWVDHDAADPTIDWWKATIPGQAGTVQVRYKIALFNGSSGPVGTIPNSDAGKVYGITRYAVTNFNPTTAPVWLHNDLNPANTTTGLANGFHIVRGRAFLPRSGGSAVYNTFAQTFYYDSALPTGVIAFPTTDGTTVGSPSYTVVVRGDPSVTEVDFTITDANGQTNGVATPIASPDAGLTQQYPALPQEFRFTYTPVASSGTATISVRLKEFGTAAYPNRFTTLSRVINAAAPARILEFTQPSIPGQILLIPTNGTYLVEACFSTNLTGTNLLFFINNQLQPESKYILRPPGTVTTCPGMNSFFYVWSLPISGSNTLALLYTNGFNLGATSVVAVARAGDPTDSDGDGVPNWLEILAGTDPYDASSYFRILSLLPGNPVEVLWSSVPGKRYQILGTTNLTQPMAPLPGALVPGSAGTNVTTWFDATPDATNRYYQIQVQIQ